jgi:hypothetical protein
MLPMKWGLPFACGLLVARHLLFRANGALPQTTPTAA